MKSALSICCLVLILFGCNSQPKVEGVWYQSYRIINGKKNDSGFRSSKLLEFRDDQFIYVRLGDPSSGKLGEAIIDTHDLKFTDDKLVWGSETVGFHHSADSIVIYNGTISLVYKRLNPELKNVEVNPQHFIGAKQFTGEVYRDKVDFVNDTLMLYTGQYYQLSPDFGWAVVDYAGYKFLNIFSNFTPVMVIESCDPDLIELSYPGYMEMEFTLTPSETLRGKDDLMGYWELTEDDFLTPSLPSLPGDCFQETVWFKEDSLKIQHPLWAEHVKWELSHDGSAIYFRDPNANELRIWKVQEVSESKLTLGVPNVDDLELKRFRKVDD